MYILVGPQDGANVSVNPHATHVQKVTDTLHASLAFCT
jgi:hypothetical protein